MGETPPVAELWKSLASFTHLWLVLAEWRILSFLKVNFWIRSFFLEWVPLFFYVILHWLLIGTCPLWLALHPMSLGGVINCSLLWHNTVILLKSLTLIHECFVRSVGLSQRMFTLQQLHMEKLLRYWCLLCFVTILRMLGIAFISFVRFWEEHLESRLQLF